jgi:peptidoglycan/LPS O-acetylase OafA/YrhL
MVAAVGFLGLLQKRLLLVIITFVSLSLYAAGIDAFGLMPGRLYPYLGEPMTAFRFTCVFACGALFYLYRDRIFYRGSIVALAAGGLTALLFSSNFAEPAIATLGGYVLFWSAFNVKSPRLARIGHNVDLSYGVYLYAWPTQKILLWLYPGLSHWLLSLETTAIASAIAIGSWYLIERPFLNLKKLFLKKARFDRPVPVEGSLAPAVIDLAEKRPE